MIQIARLLACAVICLAAGSALAGGGGRGGLPGGNSTNSLGINTNFYTNEYELLTAQVTLTEAQKPKVKAKVDAMNSELQLVLQAAQNLTAARGAAPGGGPGGGGGFGGGFGGRGGGAPAAPVPLTPEQIKLRDDFQLLADQHQVRINADLTEPQRLQWEAYKLQTFLDPKLVTLSLTEDQKEKVRTMVVDTAKSLAAMTDGKEIDVYEGRLIRRIVNEILTEGQAARLFELPLGTTSSGRGAAPAARGGAPGGGPGGPGGGPGGGRGRG